MTTNPPDFTWVGLNDFIPGIHSGHGEGGGLVALIDHLLAALSRDTPGEWTLLGGIETLGANVHPLLVHFPIAFLTGFVLIESFGLIFGRPRIRQWASGLLYLGAGSAVISALFGLLAAESVPHGAGVHDIMAWHQRAGLTVAALSVAMALWRGMAGLPASTMSLALSLLLTGILAVVLFVGADLGGMMVYKHGVAVQNLQPTDSHQHHLHGGTVDPAAP